MWDLAVVLTGFLVAAFGAPWGCDNRRWRGGARQDRFIYDHFFSYLESADGDFYHGFFVEAGAYNGLTSSNTAALEECFGWEGLLVEPNPTAFSALSQNRPRSRSVHGCLTAREEERSLIAFDEKDGLDWAQVSVLAKHDDDAIRPDDDVSHSRLAVRCVPLKALLAEMKVEKVDYLSLDAESSELEILQGIDWENGPKIDFISIETLAFNAATGLTNDKVPQRQVRVFLETHGYQLLARLGDDDFYYRSDRSGQVSQRWCSSAAPLTFREDMKKPMMVVEWSLLAEMLTVMLDVPDDEKGKVETLATLDWVVAASRYAAQNDSLELICPLGVLTSRLVMSFVNSKVSLTENAYCHHCLESSIMREVFSHEVLFSDKQRDRAWAVSPPEAKGGAPAWRPRELPLPRLFLADFDFVSVLRGGWPVFQAFDFLSLHLHWASPPPMDFLPFSSWMGNTMTCADGQGEREDLNDFLSRSEACGLIAISSRRLTATSKLLEIGQSSKAIQLLHSVEIELKNAVLARGLYWLLFFSGGEDPTIWVQLARLGQFTYDLRV